MILLEYNPENLSVISEIIRSKLTYDLLPRKWFTRNMLNPTFGHCHNAAGCLYKIFGHENVHMYRALDDEGIWHWWAVDLNGNLIDLTVEQYTSVGRVPPHADGTKSSILGFEYRKRVQRLLDKVTKELSENGTPL